MEILSFIHIEAGHVEIVHVGIALFQLCYNISKVYDFIHIVQLRIIKLVATVFIAIIILIIIFITHDLAIIILILNYRIMFILTFLIFLLLHSLLSYDYRFLAEEYSCFNESR